MSVVRHVAALDSVTKVALSSFVRRAFAVLDGGHATPNPKIKNPPKWGKNTSGYYAKKCVCFGQPPKSITPSSSIGHVRKSYIRYTEK